MERREATRIESILGHGMQVFVVLMLGVLVAGCAAQRPVLYPNEHYRQSGEAAAARAVEYCMLQAKHFAATPAGQREAEQIAAETAVAAGSGAAIGAVGAAVGGGNAGRGAAVGAATGATAGFIHSVLRTIGLRRRPSPVVQRFVDRCLRERGYEPIGWE